MTIEREIMDAFFAHLDRELAGAVMAGCDLAVSPLETDDTHQSRWRFERVPPGEQSVARQGWTIYHTSMMPVAASVSLL